MTTKTKHISGLLVKLMSIWLMAACFYLAPNNMHAQCTTPTAVDTSICGPGSGALTAKEGAKALYNWYDQGTGGTLLGSGTNIASPSVSATDTFYVAQYDTGATTDALRFDGTNDYIAIEDYHYSAGGHTELTVECWVKPDDGGNHVLASYDRNRYWRLEINGTAAGTGQVGFGIMTDAGQLDFSSIGTVDDGQWHHIAAVYDNGAVRIYIDGVLDNSTTKGTSYGDGTTSYGYVGVGSESTTFDGAKGPTYYFDGDLDEFRIWSTARTVAEISANKDGCLNGSQLGLEVYYRMDGIGTQDTLIDYTAQGHTGDLQNFTLPAAWISSGTALSFCPNCESTRDTLVLMVNPKPVVSVGNDTCSTTDVVLDAGSGFNGYTWNTGETTQSITASSSGFYYVNVDSTGTPCQGVDGVTVSLLSQPSGTDTSRCGPGTVTLTASGGSGKYYWYDSPIGGNIVGEGTPFTTPSFASSDTLYLASIENDTTDQSLTFDGTDDYVSLNMVFNTLGALPTMTVEAWVKTSESGVGEFNNWSIVDFDRSDYFNLYVHGSDGRVGFSTADKDGTIDDFYAPIANRVNDGVWHHVAATYNGTDKMIYVDGSLVATKSNPHNGKALGKGTTRYGFLGDGSEATSENGARNNLYFDGQIDEVRIWNDVRNLLEIQENKDKCILGVEDNLLAYYKMENGSGTTLTDHSNNGHDGTLRNMAASVWNSTGPIVTCSCGDSDRDTVSIEIKIVPTVSLGNDTCVIAAYALDAGAGMSAYLWQDGSTAQTLSANTSKAYWVTIDSAGTDCQGKDTIVVNVGKAADPTAVDSSRCGTGLLNLVATGQGELNWYDAASGGSLLGTGDTLQVGPLSADSTFYVASTIKNKNGLKFDGSNDQVAIKNFNYSAGGQTEMTVEAWIRTSSTGDNIVASFDRSEYWRLEINGDAAGPGQVGFGINTNSGIADIASTGTVNDGNWHHLAAVYDNGAIRIYIDGTLDGSGALGTTMGSGATRWGFLGTGSEANTYNGTTGPDYWFDGDIDEFRVWNIVRSGANINLYKDSCLTGGEAGLQIYYRMSAGSGNSLNDYTGSNHGAIDGPSWITDGNGFQCSKCSESDRIPITATINNNIDSVQISKSCTGALGTVFKLQGFGGSGNFDYEELSGNFSYTGSYTSAEVQKTLPNGGTFNIEIKDENKCLDTISSISTWATPTATISSSGSAQTCKIHGTNGYFYLVDASNKVILSIDSKGSDLGDVDATVYVDGTAGVSDGEAYLRRHFVITPEFQPASSADVRIYFSAWELSNLIDSANATSGTNDDISSIGDLGITKYNGPTEDGTLDVDDATSLVFIPQTESGTEFGSNYIQFTVPSFSEIWSHGAKNAKPLAVELVKFDAKLVDDIVTLNWVTSSEINNDYFEIERSHNGNHWEVIQMIYSNGTTSNLTWYSAKDEQPLIGKSYYRIKQVDYDGSTSYSDLVSINYNTSKEIIAIYPNPNKGSFSLEMRKLTPFSKVEITVSDITGRSYILMEEYADDNGFKNVQINLPSELNSGNYIVTCRSNNIITTKLLVVE